LNGSFYCLSRVFFYSIVTFNYLNLFLIGRVVLLI